MTEQFNYKEDFDGCITIDLAPNIWMLIEGDRATDVFIGDGFNCKVAEGGFYIKRDLE
jgi:hypothetical protein